MASFRKRIQSIKPYSQMQFKHTTFVPGNQRAFERVGLTVSYWQKTNL